MVEGPEPLLGRRAGAGQGLWLGLRAGLVRILLLLLLCPWPGIGQRVTSEIEKTLGHSLSHLTPPRRQSTERVNFDGQGLGVR